MTPDASPDNVRLLRARRLAVLERGSAIRRPGHLPDAGGALDSLHSESTIEALWLLSESSDEPCESAPESNLLSTAEPFPVVSEPVRLIVSRHEVGTLGLFGLRAVREALKERLVAIVMGERARRDLLVGLQLPCEPPIAPKPGLVRIEIRTALRPNDQPQREPDCRASQDPEEGLAVAAGGTHWWDCAGLRHRALRYSKVGLRPRGRARQQGRRSRHPSVMVRLYRGRPPL